MFRSSLFTLQSDDSIFRFCPFQRDKWAFQSMESHESFIQIFAFFLQHSHRHFYARISQFLDAATLHFCKRVHASHHASFQSFADNQIGARWSLSIMGTRFQTHINRSIFQQMLIFFLHRSQSIHLRMSFSASHVIPFSNDSPLTNNNSPHHRVGLCILLSVASQLNATVHIC